MIGLSTLLAFAGQTTCGSLTHPTLRAEYNQIQLSLAESYHSASWPRRLAHSRYVLSTNCQGSVGDHANEMLFAPSAHALLRHAMTLR